MGKKKHLHKTDMYNRKIMDGSRSAQLQCSVAAVQLVYHISEKRVDLTVVTSVTAPYVPYK